MKFAVIISNPERVSFDEIKDVNYTKIFDETDSFSDIIKWADNIREKSDIGPKKAEITDLKFSHICP